MYMRSTSSITLSCPSCRPKGRSLHVLIANLGGVFLVVLPLIDPKFGPKKSSEHKMSFFCDWALRKHVALYVVQNL